MQLHQPADLAKSFRQTTNHATDRAVLHEQPLVSFPRDSLVTTRDKTRHQLTTGQLDMSRGEQAGGSAHTLSQMDTRDANT